jgi:hypothetical protein
METISESSSESSEYDDTRHFHSERRRKKYFWAKMTSRVTRLRLELVGATEESKPLILALLARLEPMLERHAGKKSISIEQ